MTRFTFDPNHSEVRIEGSSSVHPIHATATGLEGWIDVETDDDGTPRPGAEVHGQIEIEVDRLRSGNSLVDRETRRRIDSSRYPRIVGTVDQGRVQADHTIAVEGQIDFRGESQDVEGTLDVTVDEPGSLVVEGSSRFDVRRWGLEPPRLLALRVHPEIDVRIRVVAWQ